MDGPDAVVHSGSAAATSSPAASASCGQAGCAGSHGQAGSQGSCEEEACQEEAGAESSEESGEEEARPQSGEEEARQAEGAGPEEGVELEEEKEAVARAAKCRGARSSGPLVVSCRFLLPGRYLTKISPVIPEIPP